MPAIDNMLRLMVEKQASDLHLTTGLKPYLRVHGEMLAMDAFEPLTSDGIVAMLNEFMRETNRDQFRNEWDTDCAHEVSGLGRFRVNCFFDMRGAGSVIRQIPERIPTIEELNLPVALRDFCMMSKGLVVVTGPTGSGKSTTLAALVDYINKRRTEHIITIEDPIEFVHHPIKCLINQREVHRDTTSFARALRAALREDPDIVLVGEMRDLETMEIAIETAETGHLVFATLHTNTAATTVDRIIDKFPSDRQNQIRSMLGDALKGVVAQTLCRQIGGGRIASFEVLLVNIPVANLIREGKTFMIPSVMQTSRNIGMQTFSDDLARLAAKGKITPEEAYIKSIDKDSLRVALTNAGIPLAFLEQAKQQDAAARTAIAATAVEQLRARLQQNPSDLGTINDLAWILATSPIDAIRNGKEAVRLGEQAREMTHGEEPAVLDTLSAAYAEIGKFSRSVECMRKAIALATKRNDLPMLSSLNMRIKNYLQNQPYRTFLSTSISLPASSSSKDLRINGVYRGLNTFSVAERGSTSPTVTKISTSDVLVTWLL
jgi:twitching motility protein PilT